MRFLAAALSAYGGNYCLHGVDRMHCRPIGDLVEAIERGDTGAKRLLLETADDFAFGLSHAVHLFNPEIIILGGGLSFLGFTYIQMIKDKLCGYMMKAMNPPEVLPSVLKEDVVCLGASLLAKEGFLSIKL